MSAHASIDDGRGWLGGRVLVVWACLAGAILSARGGRSDQMTLPDGAVVISDGTGDSAPPVADDAPYAEGPYDLADAGGVTIPPAAGPRWDVAVDALLLWQGNAASMPLLLDTAGAAALDVGTMGTVLTAGPRVSLIRYLGECHAIEGNYFQARPFNSSREVPPGGGPYTLVNAGDIYFDDVESAMASGSGWIQSAELNWRRNECGSPITWLAGFRWVELNSQVNVDYAFTNPDPFGSGSMNVASGNNLYGGQAGLDLRLWNGSGIWRVNGLAKAGLFANVNAFQRSTAGFVTSDGEPFPLGSVSANADQVAFFGEVGLNSTYWITRWLAWRAGYTVFWASGVAVAAQQLPLNNFGDGTAKINTTGSVMLHGVTTGFEARW